MKKNKRKPLLLWALTGLCLSMPFQNAYVPKTVEAAQVSASHDSKLSAFDIAPGVLSPAFSPDILEYTSTVDAGVTSVRVQAVPRASGAVIASVEGRDGLHPGVNTIKATCSAQDNTFTVYTITLTVGSADAGTQQAGSTQPDAGDTGNNGPQPDAGNAGSTQPDAGGAGGTDPQPNAGNAGSNGTQPDAGTTGNNGTQPDAGNAGGTGTQPDTGTTGNTNTGVSGQDSADAGNANPDAALDAKQDGTASKKKKSVASRLTGTVKADGTVKLSGAAYRLSGNFTYGATTQDIPSAFGQGSMQIGDTNYATLYCAANGVHLVYMENTDSKGSTGFYYYDEKKHAVERFKYAGSGDNFVVFISNAREEAPAGYQEVSLKLPSGKKVAAYQNISSDELQDYYLIYGIHAGGENGWYLYDNLQGTYIRFSHAFAALLAGDDGEEEQEVARTVSLEKYNSLNGKYTELKESRVRIVSILAIAIVLLIILFTAILLRSREEEEDDETTGSRERGAKKKPAKKPKKQAEPVSKSSLAAGRNFEGNVGKNAKKVTKTFTQDMAEDGMELLQTDGSRPKTAPQGPQQMGDSRPKTGFQQAGDSRQKTGFQQAADSRPKTGAQGFPQTGDSRQMGLQQAGDSRKNASVRQDSISTPEEIRAQVSRGQAAYGQDSRIKNGNGQRLNKQRTGSPDAMPTAAENMRQPAKYSRTAPKAEPAGPEHDPMDDWDVEETISRKQKSGKTSRKKRGRRDDEMEIMDLNDL